LRWLKWSLVTLYLAVIAFLMSLVAWLLTDMYCRLVTLEAVIESHTDWLR